MTPPESAPIDFGMITIQELPRTDQNRHVRFTRIAAACVGLSVLAYGAHISHEDSATQLQTAQTQSTDHEQKEQPANAEIVECSAPSASDISAVENLFARPALEYKYPDTWDETQPQKFMEYYESVLPKQFGVTIHSAEHIYEISGGNLKATPFSDVLNVTQRFMEQYGIDVHVITKEEAKQHVGLAYSVPKAEVLESPDVKLAVLALVEGMSNIPEELVRQNGLKHILLVTEGDGFAGLAETGGAHDTVLISVDQASGLGSTLIQHEFTHIFDATVCGGPEAAGNDPTYKSINESVQYDNTISDEIFLKAIKARPLSLKAVQDVSTNYIHSPTNMMPCDIAHTFEQNTVVFSDYAYTNVVEDKAELGQNLFSMYGYQYVMDKRFPALRQKALVLLARMYRQNPKVVEYYAAIAHRPDSPDPLCEPNKR